MFWVTEIFLIKCTGVVPEMTLITFGEFFLSVAMPIAVARIIFVGFVQYVIWISFLHMSFLYCSTGKSCLATPPNSRGGIRNAFRIKGDYAQTPLGQDSGKRGHKG